MLDSIRFWFVFLCIAGTILAVGWKQPLRYRFLSAEEIYRIEHPEPPAPPKPDPATGPAWMYDERRRTPLDREPYNPTGYKGGGARGLQQGQSPSIR